MPRPIPRTPLPDEHLLVKAFRNKLSTKNCRFMIFGPNPNFSPATDLRKALLKKRLEIREYIRNQLSCDADFPEELFANAVTDIPVLSNNIVRLELEAAREHYDLVIILIEAPGSLVELGYFCCDVQVREKTAVFLLEDHRAGLAANAAEADARYCSYYVNDDLDRCNLLTKIGELVAKVQSLKFLAP